MKEVNVTQNALVMITFAALGVLKENSLIDDDGNISPSSDYELLTKSLVQTGALLINEGNTQHPYKINYDSLNPKIEKLIKQAEEFNDKVGSNDKS